MNTSKFTKSITAGLLAGVAIGFSTYASAKDITQIVPEYVYKSQKVESDVFYSRKTPGAEWDYLTGSQGKKARDGIKELTVAISDLDDTIDHFNKLLPTAGSVKSQLENQIQTLKVEKENLINRKDLISKSIAEVEIPKTEFSEWDYVSESLEAKTLNELEDIETAISNLDEEIESFNSIKTLSGENSDLEEQIKKLTEEKKSLLNQKSILEKTVPVNPYEEEIPEVELPSEVELPEVDLPVNPHGGVKAPDYRRDPLEETGTSVQTHHKVTIEAIEAPTANIQVATVNGERESKDVMDIFATFWPEILDIEKHYGRGYQINVHVLREDIKNAKAILRTYLEKANLAEDLENIKKWHNKAEIGIAALKEELRISNTPFGTTLGFDKSHLVYEVNKLEGEINRIKHNLVYNIKNPFPVNPHGGVKAPDYRRDPLEEFGTSVKPHPTIAVETIEAPKANIQVTVDKKSDVLELPVAPEVKMIREEVTFQDIIILKEDEEKAELPAKPLTPEVKEPDLDTMKSYNQDKELRIANELYYAKQELNLVHEEIEGLVDIQNKLNPSDPLHSQLSKEIEELIKEKDKITKKVLASYEEIKALDNTNGFSRDLEIDRGENALDEIETDISILQEDIDRFVEKKKRSDNDKNQTKEERLALKEEQNSLENKEKALLKRRDRTRDILISLKKDRDAVYNSVPVNDQGVVQPVKAASASGSDELNMKSVLEMIQKQKDISNSVMVALSGVKFFFAPEDTVSVSISGGMINCAYSVGGGIAWKPTDSIVLHGSGAINLNEDQYALNVGMSASF